MGRIVASVTVVNPGQPDMKIRCDALVDTGASYMTLPKAWRDRLGVFDSCEEVELATATQEVITGEMCGPAKIQVEGFRAVHNDIIFVDMEPEDGTYEPLIGYIVLEQCQAAVDMLGHRLVPVKYLDLK